MNKHIRNILIFLGLALVAFLIWVYKFNKPKKAKKAAAIAQAIKDNIDLTGTPDEGLKQKIDVSKADNIAWTEADKSKADKLAKDINSALGYFQEDDPQAVSDAIKSAGNQRFLGLVASTFFTNEGITMYAFFDRHLDKADKNILLDVINKLPA